MVRGAARDPGRGKRFAAVVALVGAVDIPFIHMSVYGFRSLHPEPVVLRPEEQAYFDEVTEGRTVGTTSADLWLHPDTPLVIRWTLDDESITDSRAGDVRYVEQMTVELVSSEPGS